MKLKVCIAGATGWVGKPLCAAVSAADDLNLVGAVSRIHKGHNLKEFFADPGPGLIVSGSVAEALNTPTDERLTLRHDAGSGTAPYILGTLLAIRKVRDRVGLIRGLDRIMD